MTYSPIAGHNMGHFSVFLPDLLFQSYFDLRSTLHRIYCVLLSLRFVCTAP